MIQRIAIFLGSFLVFLVQPLIGNTLLPHFGGSATVWSACLAVFQTLLVGGYFYAHLMGRNPGADLRRRMTTHVVLLVLAASWLGFVAFNYTSVIACVVSLPPILGVVAVVTCLVAGPYIFLSANSTLVQTLACGRYSLYAVSNVGSLFGLWAYPFVFERCLSLPRQWVAFAVLSALYAVTFAVLVLKGVRERLAVAADRSGARGVGNVVYFALSFLSCFLLNAVSTHLCTDITPLPLVWVALLSAYLLSYVLGYSDRLSRVAPWMTSLAFPLAVFCLWHSGVLGFAHFRVELLGGLALLFAGGWIIHARLYRLRPSADRLTSYYLFIAIGGAAGGCVCSFVLPLVSNAVVEYPLSIALLVGVMAFDVRDEMGRRWKISFADPRWRLAMPVVLVALALFGVHRMKNAEGRVLRRYRNFYGVGHVAHRAIEVSGGLPGYQVNEFVCNGTTHGMQIVRDGWKAMTPTVYYAEHAGGLPLLNHPKAVKKMPIRVALCGMGIGTLAAYSRPGDFYRFYEINSAIAAFAQDEDLFTFVPKAAGKVEVVIDDARHALEGERARNEPRYDIVVVDVFNGDAIPPHLATREAVRLYLDRLEDDGILAFHLSNWHLELLPMAKAAAKEFGLEIEAFYCCPSLYAFESTWAFLSRKKLPDMYHPRRHTRVDFNLVGEVPLMTDDFHSLLPYVQLLTRELN